MLSIYISAGILLLFAVSAVFLHIITPRRVLLLLLLSLCIIALRAYYNDIQHKRALSVLPYSTNLYPVNISLNRNAIIEVRNTEFIELSCNSPVFMALQVPQDGYINTRVETKKKTVRKSGTKDPSYRFQIHIIDELLRLKTIIDIPFSKDAKYIGKDINIDLSRYNGQYINMTLTLQLTGPEELLTGNSKDVDTENILVRYPVLHRKVRLKKKYDSLIQPREIKFFNMEDYR